MYVTCHATRGPPMYLLVAFNSRYIPVQSIIPYILTLYYSLTSIWLWPSHIHYSLVSVTTICIYMVCMHMMYLSSPIFLGCLQYTYYERAVIWHAFIISGFFQLYHLISEHSLCICIYIWYIWSTIPLLSWLHYICWSGFHQIWYIWAAIPLLSWLQCMCYKYDRDQNSIHFIT